jgi:LacI family transcriptional regulator
VSVIFTPASDFLADNHQDLAEQAVDDLVGRAGCDAILVTQDRWAVEIVRAVNRRGIAIPKDLAVMGFENREICTAVEPRLTCLDYQFEATAQAMMDMAVRLIEQGPAFKGEPGVFIPPRLVVRDST